MSLYQGNYLEAYANWAVYAEDEWKIRRNLTIDLGLRYDAFPPPNLIQGTINDRDANSGIWYIGGGNTPRVWLIENPASLTLERPRPAAFLACYGLGRN